MYIQIDCKINLFPYANGAKRSEILLYFLDDIVQLLPLHSKRGNYYFYLLDYHLKACMFPIYLGFPVQFCQV